MSDNGFNQTVNFSVTEAAEYYRLCTRVKNFNYVMGRTLDTSFVASGLIGLALNVLTLFIQQRMSFSRSTLISYQSMTVIELFHMIIMAQSGILRWIRIRMGARMTEEDHTAMTTWSYQYNDGWHMGDAAKLTVSAITTFVSLERMIAVCFPLVLKKMKSNTVVYVGILISVIIGSGHLWPLMGVHVEYDAVAHGYKIIKTDFQTSTFYILLPGYIFGMKIFLSVVIFASSVAMIVTLKVESKKQMFSNVTAKSAWIARRRLCMFSFITGISILCDHVVWVLFKTCMGLINSVYQPCESQLENFEKATWDLWKAQSITWLYFAQGFTGELVHCYRFFIHFGLNKAMRDAFWKAMPGKRKEVNTTSKGTARN